MTAQFQADQLGEIKNHWLSLTSAQRSALVLVCRHIGKLGPVACEILSREASRLGSGASLGDFGDEREYVAETIEEMLDSVHYLQAALLKLERAASRKEKPSNGHASKTPATNGHAVEPAT